MSLKRKIGVYLVKVGSKLAFTSDEHRDQLKAAINYITYIGAHNDSGGHLLEPINPMCVYDSQSVINALKSGDFCKDSYITSKKEFYYKENWI